MIIGILNEDARNHLAKAFDKVEARLKKSTDVCLNVDGANTLKQTLAKADIYIRHRADFTFNFTTCIQISVPVKQDRERYAREIFRIVCHKNNFTIPEIQARNKKEDLVICRHMAAALMREKTFISLKRIGKIIKRDHATIISSVDESFDLWFTNKKYAAIYNYCKAEAEKLEGTEIRMQTVTITKNDLVDTAKHG